ncbi:MAG: hypothetical protein JNK30_13010 [Phenylobacterium sp.]|uniref:hypothetical protein n=1 Tax=Phenylobacterium sp. TaxID=1871053 RepID=UPI001A5E750A|nr:hypothetical protein [Phenylobacterium sp.]MBL8772294.1 hypothetical protein [Phenylobacterium sp.]
MIRLLATGAACALLASTTAFATEPLQVSYPADAQMDCAAIATESGRMDQVIADANAQIAKAESSAKGAGVAGAVAVEGMLRTGLLGRMPGVGQMANQATNMARQRAEQVKAQAGQTISTAGTRKALLAGLYSGKGCDAPAAAAAPTEPTGF